MAIDLHLHSTSSDGVLTPKELVDKAVNLNLRAIAITDHDSVEGVAVALEEGKLKGIEIVPAVELSSGLDCRDIHFLGYYIDHRNKKFCQQLVELRKYRTERASKMVELLQKNNIGIPFEEVLNAAGNGSLSRAHVAKVMVNRGYIDSIEEAFEKYIGREGPCFVEKYYFAPQKVIEMIVKTGGIAVLAHPGLSEVDDYIPKFISYGIKGIEVLHGEHTEEQSKYYLELAKKYNLIPTGGSDYHGLKRSKRGREIGSINVPDSYLDGLKKIKTSKI